MAVKIIFVITQSGWGGAQKYVYEMAMAWNVKHEIKVICGKADSGGQDLTKKLKVAGIDVVNLSGLVRDIGWRDALGFWQLLKIFRKERPDIIFLNSTKSGFLGAVVGKISGCRKVIFTAHGFVFNERLSIIKRLFYIWLTKFSVLFIDKIITVSGYDFDAAVAVGIPLEKMTVIHNGVKKLDFLSKDEAKLFLEKKVGVKLTRPIVGGAAYFYRNKGLNFLIEVADKLRDRCDFIILGDGERRPELEKLIKDLKLSNVFLVGEIANGYRYFKAFDIFALSSLKEGLPFVLLEALSAGVPVAATKVGGVPEVVVHGENGVLTPPADPAALADAINFLLNKREIRGYLDEEFYFDVMLKKTEELIT